MKRARRAPPVVVLAADAARVVVADVAPEVGAGVAAVVAVAAATAVVVVVTAAVAGKGRIPKLAQARRARLDAANVRRSPSS